MYLQQDSFARSRFEITCQYSAECRSTSSNPVCKVQNLELTRAIQPTDLVASSQPVRVLSTLLKPLTRSDLVKLERGGVRFPRSCWRDPVAEISLAIVLIRISYSAGRNELASGTSGMLTLLKSTNEVCEGV